MACLNISSFAEIATSQFIIPAVNLSSFALFVSGSNVVLQYLSFSSEFCQSFSYADLVKLSINEILNSPVIRFLPDYHAIRFIAENTNLSTFEVFDVFTWLANLLRLMNENNVQEVHLGAIRIKKALGFFVITDY